MRRTLVLIKRNCIFLLIFVATLGYAQEKKHIAESKGLVGFWCQLKPYWEAGEMELSVTGSYKIINTDGSFYNFLALKNEEKMKGGVKTVFLYGNYEITSDSTYTEHITRNINSITDNTISNGKYRFLSEDMIVVSFKNEKIANGERIWEIWARVKKVGEEPTLSSKEEIKEEIKKVLFPR